MTLISQEQFKQGMQLLAASVSVVTSSSGGTRRGMTATAVSSLAADPPSLVVSINRSARTFENIMNSRKLCVNLLAEHQQDIANVFASSSGDSEAKFESCGVWGGSSSGQPILNESVANFVCEVDRWAITKTHCVLIVHITEIMLRADLRPLMYYARNYAGLDTNFVSGK